MAVYTYRALSGGDDVTGTIAAETPRQARTLLGERGLIVRDVRDAGVGSKVANRFRIRLFSPVRRHELTAIFGETATLLSVGVPLLEALDTLARQYVGGAHDAIVKLRDRVAGGSSMAAAMREQPDVFDDLAINIAEVGEDAGTLDNSLLRLSEFREKSDQLRNRAATALIYPTIVTILGILCSVFLMSFVVPKILQPLIEQNLPLPLPTRIVKAASDQLVAYWPILLVVVVAVGGVIAYALPTDRGQYRWHVLLLRLPLLGTLVRKQMMVRVAVVLSTLLKNGIVLTRAMQIAQKTVGNRVMADALRDVEMQVTAGTELAGAMESSGVFPPMVVQVFALGQQSGQLEEMLDRLAAAYESQVTIAAQRLAAVLEPAMIVLLAGFVLFLVLATVLPILEVGNAIQ